LSNNLKSRYQKRIFVYDLVSPILSLTFLCLVNLVLFIYKSLVYGGFSFAHLGLWVLAFVIAMGIDQIAWPYIAGSRRTPANSEVPSELTSEL